MYYSSSLALCEDNVLECSSSQASESKICKVRWSERANKKVNVFFPCVHTPTVNFKIISITFIVISLYCTNTTFQERG